MQKQIKALEAILADPAEHSRCLLRRPLRAYQVEPARAIVRSILEGAGLSFVVMMSRQSGKNELSAHLEAYLLTLFHKRGGQIVKASPTFKPQTVNSRDRLRATLERGPFADMVRLAGGYQIHMGRASCHFFTASPKSHVVGATADLLLECDEAQDVLPDKWDKDFVPMTASTHATRVLWGTAWTTTTLLHRELVAAQAEERRDGRRRVFLADYRVVQAEVPAYALHVAEQLRRLGADHPLFLTQYALQPIDDRAGFIAAPRQQLLQGLHAPHDAPQTDAAYAFALDVGGGAEQQDPSAHDWTALTIAQVHRGEDLPAYEIVARRAWQGANQPTLYEALLRLVQEWNPTAIAVDATGLGMGLAERLSAALPGRVQPYVFNRATKSALGWQLLAAIDALRLRDHRRRERSTNPHEYEAIDKDAVEGDGQDHSCSFVSIRGCRSSDPLQEAFWQQVQGATATYGANQTIAWGLPAPAHDDLLVSAALLTTLDAHVGGASAGFQVIRPRK